MTVTFINVGRDKKNWSRKFSSEITETSIAKEAKAKGGIMSSIVDAEFDDSGSSGVIIVGGWREVGKFTISAE